VRGRQLSLFDGPGSTRWLARSVALAFFAALATALVSSAPASALSQRGHVYSSSFPSASEPPEAQLVKADGVAVNEATGKVYVVDAKERAVDMYDASGKFIGRFEKSTPALAKVTLIAVDNDTSTKDPSAGDVYVINGDYVLKFSSSGKFIDRVTSHIEFEEFGHPMGITVDGQGFLWVSWTEGYLTGFSPEGARTEAEPYAPEIAARPGLAVRTLEATSAGVPNDEFFESWEPIEVFGDEGSEVPCSLEPCAIAKLSTVEQELEHAVAIPPGEVVSPDLASGPISDIAAEVTGDDIVVDEGFALAVYTDAGELVQRLGGGQLEGATGVAVDQRTGAIYVADTPARKIEVFVPEPPGAPSIDRTAASGVSSSSAALEASVDADGQETAISFEYGSSNCAQGGCTDAEGTTLPASFGDGSTHSDVSGLAPGTTYDYRIVATNGSGSATAEGTFETDEAPFVLADHRAWELVTPAQKYGAGVESISLEGGLIQAAPDGNAITFITTGPDEPSVQGNRSPAFQQIVASRSEHGPGGAAEWSSKDIATENGAAEGVDTGHDQEYRFFSSDLSRSVVQPIGLTPEVEQPLVPEVTERSLFVREDDAGCDMRGETTPSSCFAPVVSKSDDATGARYGGVYGDVPGVKFETATPSVEHVVFHSEAVLTEEVKDASENELYEWDAASNTLRLVSELPNGNTASGARVGFSPGVGDVRNAISEDGSRVFWAPEAGKEGGGHLYVREPYVANPKSETGEGRTVQIDVPEKGIEEEAVGGAEFQDASADGSRVFFTDRERLTANASTQGKDLYVCELTEVEVEGEKQERCNLTDLSAPAGSESAGVQQFIPGISDEISGEDGTTVYFVANGVLTSTPNSQGEHAVAGHCVTAGAIATSCNLYVRHMDTATGEWEAPVFIARLSGEDSPDWSDQSENLQGVTSRVSPNGQYLAFMSERSLTGYDNRDVNPAAHEARDEEVYLYDLANNSLACASCDPNGERPQGVLDHEEGGEGLGLLIDRFKTWENSSVGPAKGRWLAATIPGWTSAEGFGPVSYQSRYLSDNGRLFFDSASPLVPAAQGDTRSESLDTNGNETTVGVSNVYEYEPDGTGTCAAEPACVAILSSPASHQESAFLDADETGDNVFFVTSASLVPQDEESSDVVYDARVCSPESPCVPTATTKSSVCESNPECREGSGEVPAFTSPSTANDGIGNAAGGVLGKTQEHPPTSKPLTRQQHLKKALAACKSKYKRSKKKRTKCEVTARKKYGPKPKPKHKTGKKG
jgi:hypothetical protein